MYAWLLCKWLGICDSARVVLPTEPVSVVELLLPVAVVLPVDNVPTPTANVPALTVTDTEPEGVCDANAVVNATEPPEPAVPETTRSALLSCVVLFVQPVGAAVCTNNITVPVGMPAQAPLKIVADSVPVLGLKLNLVLDTYAVVIAPEVAFAHTG